MIFAKTDDSEKHIASVIMVEIISELVTTLAATIVKVLPGLVTTNGIPGTLAFSTLMLEGIFPPKYRF